MYSREQASQLWQQFWTTFGQYMAPVPSEEAGNINWLNYLTVEKHVYFRLQVDNKKASVAIVLTHPDAGIQQIYFEQFSELKNLLHRHTTEEWIWLLHTYDEEGKRISKIYTERLGLNVMRKEDWPALVSFFKPRIMALDRFWSEAKYSFEALR